MVEGVRSRGDVEAVLIGVNSPPDKSVQGTTIRSSHLEDILIHAFPIDLGSGERSQLPKKKKRDYISSKNPLI